MFKEDEIMWPLNVTGLDVGIYRTIKGNSDEMIAVGRCMKAGFNCSRVDISNGKYDAVIDCGNGKLLRVQIKGTTNGSLNFTGGGRSGAQISRTVASRKYKYCEKDCDIILGINSVNGECYIIPISELNNFGETKALSKLEDYKENWDLLKKLSED